MSASIEDAINRTMYNKISIKRIISLCTTTSIFLLCCFYLLQNEGESEIKTLIYRILRSENTHKDLFPLDTSDYIGLLCATLGLMIAAGGGVGGGGVLVPILILIMGFKAKYAIPLSNITVLGGAFANTILNAPKRHPQSNRPLVDWNLLFIMEPLTIAGSLLGAFLNKVLNETVLIISLVLLLSFTAYSTLNKAMKMYRKETLEMKSKENEIKRMLEREDEEDNEKESLIGNMESSPLEEEEEKVEGMSSLELEEDPRLVQILQKESQVPKYNMIVLASLFTTIMVMNVLKGGGAFKSPLGIVCGSLNFWIANAFMILACAFALNLARNELISQYYMKRELSNYPKVEGDIDWNERNTIIYPCICCAAGFFAGMFGVGGGIVKGPLMLAMGVHPAVASGTSAVMILFTSFPPAASFIVFGLMIYDYAVFFFIVGFTATFVGQLLLNQLMKKNGRNSYIAFSIGFIVLLSAFLMTIQSMISIIEGKSGGGGGVCT